MAKSTRKKTNNSAPSKTNFSESLLRISHRFPLGKVFDDFLTMSMAACTQNPVTKVSYYEDEYLATIAPYKDSELRHEFPKAFASLIIEMEERTDSSVGNDVLGDFFEQNISNGRNGQYFTPWPVCQLLASLNTNDSSEQHANEIEKPLRILDPACGSGRMLLASRKANGIGHEYYGIDIDNTCIKMSALNLFFNGMWNSEVMCANSLSPDDFVISYRISLLPFGIFKVQEKEKSNLWQLHKNSFIKPAKESHSSLIKLDTTPFNERPKDNSIQMDLF